MQRNPTKTILMSIIIILLLAVAFTAGYIYFDKSANDDQSAAIYRTVNEDVVSRRKHPSKDDTAPIQIDWDKLKQINPDVVGWIYIGSINVSYPILQAEDNDYYLHRTITGEYLYAGSIFLDMNNSADFSDPHSIIYGHNMIDGTMFGKLWQIPFQDAAKKDPYFWVLTPTADFKYQIFSAFETPLSDTLYPFFGPDDPSLVIWADERKNDSVAIYPKHHFTSLDRIVTLSTCGATSQDRTVVLGVLVKTVGKE